VPARRAGAPRLIEWTGERCVPWAPDIQVIYEHYHRYLWARELVAGRRVLDVGSGEGFGSNQLAETARQVVGIDVDELTVRHSQLNYAAPGLEFRVASATDLGDFPDDAFDAVVAFEVIEHISDQEAVLAEVARVLAVGGLLVISTPDRLVYSKETRHKNPFHERELSSDELQGLLSRWFASIEMFAQRTATGSRIEALGPDPQGRHLGFQIERAGEEWRVGGSMSPLYLIGVASDSALPNLPSGSTLSDFGLELVRAVERDRAFAEANRAEQALDERSKLVEELIDRTQALDNERRMRAQADAELAGVDASVVWRVGKALGWHFYERVGGRDSLLGRAAGGVLRSIGRRLKAGRPGPPRWQALALPRFTRPDVSIVMTVRTGAELTERCLRAILHSGDRVAYEVVIVDDAADTDTRALLDAVDGANVLGNDAQLGYVYSINRGCGAARGRHFVLLDSDTEPQPGWLSALVGRADSADDIGVVTTKLVYPDGTLQEAGGIVWQDGTPGSYGNGHDPTAPEYNCLREVDYGSAAALLVRRELWRAAGGFDELYQPRCFEDVDLCFAARALGWRVLYEPRALAMHAEGGRISMSNRSKFAAKWRNDLREQPARPC
jgi:GT2 family glycosyltransferase